ncbi:MAG: hypothetical protein IJY25_04790 [Bacilli bacterium]|nr:hypothetical protein [Bacilli bacterium]
MWNKKEKKFIVSMLVVAALCITIGFAAFSASLKINTTATVTPDHNSFKIKFSKESGSVKDGSSNPVQPIKTGDITAENAIIDNTDGPTIENLKATFKAPGDSVKYEFYVLNETAFDAYLTQVLYNGSPFRECTAGTGTDETLVANACDTIVVKITIGSSEFTGTTTSGITNVLTKQTGSQPTSEKVTVQITYNGPARADGPFTVTFGDIELVYSTAQSSTGTDSGSDSSGGAGDTNPTLVQYITNLYSPNSTVTNNSITYNVDTTNGIIDDGLGGTVSSGGNLRYYGESPNNYIDIGDTDSSGKVMLWRIIGVFETKYATDELPCNTDSDSDGHYDNCASEKLVKIIRDDSIGDLAWDSNDVNNWNTATLNTYLNTGDYYTSLSTNVTNKVENVLWNLGGLSYSSSDTNYYQDLYSEGYYKWERGTTVYSGNPTEWVGKTGLMYPSDYGYATDLGRCNEYLFNYNATESCYRLDWLYNSDYQWTITPRSSDSDDVFYVDSAGLVYITGAVNSLGVRPVLYLKFDVSIVDTKTTSGGISYYVVE